MLARGWACLHTARLPVPKIPAAKPCVSITSKLIENKRLQVLYFGHLRKTVGRGSNQRINMVGGWAREFREIVARRWRRGVYHPGINLVGYQTWVPHPCGFQGCGF